MLTAPAVVHWNERRLPEQRADLYNSFIRWLSRSREPREGRATADRTVVLLQELALAIRLGDLREQIVFSFQGVRTGAETSVVFCSARERGFRGAKGDNTTVFMRRS